MKSIADKFSRLPGVVYLLVAVVIFAASNSVVRQLTKIGAIHLIDGRNPISFCNILFAGNVCALTVLICIYRSQWNRQSLERLTGKDWLSLLGVATLSGALAPALTFTALQLTAVNNVILIGRIEAPLVLGLSVFLLRERVNRWVVAGAIVSFIGVFLTIAIQNSGENAVNMGGSFAIGTGELMAAGGAAALAASTIISKLKLRQIPLGIFTVFRTAVGVTIFFIIAVQMFGIDHFMDVFSPVLWQWMLVYGAGIVVLGQLCWFTGLKSASASEVSLASSFSPIAGILAAYIILMESPTFSQYIGGSIILVGIVLNQIGVGRKRAAFFASPPVSTGKEKDMEIGFKGV